MNNNNESSKFFEQNNSGNTNETNVAPSAPQPNLSNQNESNNTGTPVASAPNMMPSLAQVVDPTKEVAAPQNPTNPNPSVPIGTNGVVKINGVVVPSTQEVKESIPVQQQPVTQIQSEPTPQVQEQTISQTPVPKEILDTQTINQTPSEINHDESIGKIKKEDQKSPILVLIVFIILVATVSFIPQITPYFEDVLASLNIGTDSDLINDNIKDDNTKETTDEEETTEESKLYELSNETSIEYEKLVFSNFSFKKNNNKYYIDYKIQNTKVTTYSLDDNKIYFDFYDKDNKYLDTILIEETTISPNETNDFESEISEDLYNNIKKLEVTKRTSEDYPQVTLVDKTLTCTKDNDSFVYTFDDKELLKELVYNETYEKGTLSLEEYNSNYFKISDSMNVLDANDGISAKISEATDEGFTTHIVITYASLKEDYKLDKKEYFSKGVEAKTVKYELEAKGYTCK